MLSSGKAPEGLQLKLGGYNIDDVCVAYLADALSSGKAPPRLQIDLFSKCNVGDKGISYLIQAIKQDKHPFDLKIVGIPEVEAALEESRLRCLAQASIVLMQNRKVTEKIDGIKVTKCAQGLTIGVVDHIASYLCSSKGTILAGNVDRFFYVRSGYKSSLAELKVDIDDIDKVNKTLGLSHTEAMIKNILRSYMINISLSLLMRQNMTKALLSALRYIDSEDNQTLVLNEIQLSANEDSSWCSIS